MKRRHSLTLLAALAGSALAGSALAADPWPTRPIRVIVPYPAGGVVDVQTRALTIRLATELNQPIVVESRAGANANIAAEFVAKAPADGYTFMVSAPFLINNPMLETGLRWAPKDFVPVARFALSPSYFLVPASSPAKTVREYVALAKEAKEPLQYGDGGTGSTQSMSIEMLKVAAGIKLEAVMYKGAPPIVPDLANGLVSMSVIPSSVAMTALQTGKVKVLAIVSSRRSAQMPNVPTIAEAGYPEMTVMSWYGLHAPAGTPPDIIKKLQDAMAAATSTQEVKDRLAAAGGEEAFLNQADFIRFIATDTQSWDKVQRAIRK